MGAGFWRLWSSPLLTNLGDGVRAAAFPLLAAELTRDPLMVAGVAMAEHHAALRRAGFAETTTLWRDLDVVFITALR